MDNQEENTIDQANVTFVDELQIVDKSPIGMKSTNEVKTSLSDTVWDIEDMMSKPWKVATGTWKTSDVKLKGLIVNGLSSLQIPNDFIKTNVSNMQTNLLKSYSYVKFDVKFTLQLNSTRFYNGRLIMFYDPLAHSERIWTIPDVGRMPNVLIDAGNSKPVSLYVPYFNQTSFINAVNPFGYAATSTLGRFYLMPLCALHAPASAATEVDFSLYMSFHNVVFKVPVNPVLTMWAPMVPPTLYKQIKEQVLREVNQAHGFFDGIGSIFSKAKNLIGTVTSGVEKVVSGNFNDVFEDLGKIVESGIEVAADVSTVAVEVGLLDKPYVPVEDHGSFALVCGPEKYHKLDTSPFSMYLCDKNVVGRSSNDDSDMVALTRRNNLYEIVEWKTSDPVNTILHRETISPYYFQNGGDTWLSTFAPMFLYWRGVIKITISIVSTHFHAGRLVVFFQSGYSAEDNPSEWESSPFITIDLSNVENLEHTFEIPFNCVTPWASSYVDQVHGNVIGDIVIMVRNQLEAPETVSTTVDVLLSVCSGDDMRFWGIRDFISGTVPEWVYQPTIGNNQAYLTVNQSSSFDDFVNVAHMALDDERHDLEDKFGYTFGDLTPKLDSLMDYLKGIVNENSGKVEDKGTIQLIIGMMSDLVKIRHQISVLDLDMVRIIDRICNPPNEAHGKVEDVDDIVLEATLEKGNSVSVFPFNHGGLSVTTDVRDICRRFYPIGTYTLMPDKISNTIPYNIMAIPVCPTPFASIPIARIANSYVGWSGSLRYKFVFHVSNIATLVGAIQHYPKLSLSTHTNVPSLVTSTEPTPPENPFIFRRTMLGNYSSYSFNLIDEKTVVVEVPYMSEYHFLRTRDEETLTSLDAKNGLLTLKVHNRAIIDPSAKNDSILPSVAVDVYICAGDDFSLYFPINSFQSPGELTSLPVYCTTTQFALVPVA